MMRFLNPKIAVSNTFFLALFGITCLFIQPCSGQEQMPVQSLLQSPQQVKSVQWIQGPKKVTLGDIAEVNVPDGYQFVDREGASAILERMGNPVPKNLVGLLASPSAKGGIVLKFSKIGFVKDSDKDQLNPAAMMTAIQSVIDRQNIEAAKQGAPLISSAEWQLKPAYNAAENKLEWAIKAQAGKEIAVNYSVRMLGRQGVLEMVAVQPNEPNLDLAPLKRLASGITFLKGQRYSDYQRGDKVASTSLAALAANDEISDADSGSARTQAILLWGGVGAGVLVLGGLTTLVVKKPWRRKKGMIRSSRTHARRPATTTSPALSAGQIGQKSPAANAGAPVTLAVQDLQPAHRNEKTRTGERKRKKRFSFYTFHSDMVMNLTRWNYTGGFGSFTPEYHGGVNGSIPNLKTRDIQEADSANGFAREISKLIDSQQKLIEGQRRLIEEQNKLIHEKSKLIDAENSILEKQSEMLEEQQLL